MQQDEVAGGDFGTELQALMPEVKKDQEIIFYYA